jgi:hypothetical protein
MEKIKTVSMENPDKTITDYVLIDKGDGQFTSVEKTIYDEMKANEATFIQSS